MDPESRSHLNILGPRSLFGPSLDILGPGSHFSRVGHVKSIMPEILVRVLANVVEIVGSANIWKTVNVWKVLLICSSCMWCECGDTR